MKLSLVSSLTAFTTVAWAIDEAAFGHDEIIEKDVAIVSQIQDSQYSQRNCKDALYERSYCWSPQNALFI